MSQYIECHFVFQFFDFLWFSDTPRAHRDLRSATQWCGGAVLQVSIWKPALVLLAFSYSVCLYFHKCVQLGYKNREYLQFFVSVGPILDLGR